MEPYDKSISFMGRFTKRVSKYLPGMTWMNTLISHAQTDDEPLTTENDDQRPVKKLCTSNNSFTNTKYQHKNSTENHRSSKMSVVPCIPSTSNQSPTFISQSSASLQNHDVDNRKISVITCIPSTSNQSPTFISQSSASLQNHDVDNRKISVVTCIPSTSKQSRKFTSQSSASLQNHDVDNRNIKRSLSLDKSSTSYEFLTPTSSQLIKPRENESHQQCPISCHVTSTNHISSAPFRCDTFKNYGLLSERQKLTVQKSPLNYCSHVMYGGRSARSNLSKILGNIPPIHRKTGIPISPSSNSEITTTSSTFKNYGLLSERQKLTVQKSPLNYCSHVMYGGRSARSNLSKILGNIPPIHRKTGIPISPSSNSEITTTSSIIPGHISTKNKEIEENKFTIQPKEHQRHKADRKSVPIKVETTVEIVETTPEKADNKSSEISSTYSGRVDANTTRKLRVNLSTKSLGLNSDELEKTAEVNLPRISLPLTALPSINLSNTFTEDNKFTFNQPLTIEQFISQIAEETLKKSQNTNIEVNSIDQSNTKIPSKNFNIFTSESLIKESKKVAITNNHTAIENSNENVKLSQFSSVVDDPKNSLKTSLPCSGSKSEITKHVDINVNSSPKKLESINKNQLAPEKSSTELKNKWSCDSCWVSNNADIMKCMACQTPKSEESQTPLLKVIKSTTWICKNCWVPNKNEIEICVSCQTQKLGTTKKTVVQSVTCTCGDWVKNKSDCTICISCGTAKPGSAAENKLWPSTHFKFGLNNYTFEDSKIDETSNNQSKFGSSSFDNGKLDTSASEFKFGLVNNKTYRPLSTFIFGTDSISSLPVNKFNEGSIINNTDQPKSQLKFGESAITNKPIAQFKFGSDKIETEKSIFQNAVTNSNIVTQSTNECTSLVNNKKEESENSLELQNKSNKRKVNDASEYSSRQVSVGSVETNCNNSKPLINVEHKNEDRPKVKLVWGKKILIKPKVYFFGKTK